MNHQNVKEIVELLYAVLQKQRKCQIQIDFDGGKFFWKITFSNMTAAELNGKKE